MSAYFAFARSSFHSQLAYRNEVWANIFGKLVQVFARVAIWQAAYAGIGGIVVDGVSLQQMVTYALLGGAVMGATRPERIIGEIGRSLKTGDIAVWLLKPLSYPLYLFANECGSFGYRLMTRGHSDGDLHRIVLRHAAAGEPVRWLDVRRLLGAVLYAAVPDVGALRPHRLLADDELLA